MSQAQGCYCEGLDIIFSVYRFWSLGTKVRPSVLGGLNCLGNRVCCYCGNTTATSRCSSKTRIDWLVSMVMHLQIAGFHYWITACVISMVIVVCTLVVCRHQLEVRNRDHFPRSRHHHHHLPLRLHHHPHIRHHCPPQWLRQ